MLNVPVSPPLLSPVMVNYLKEVASLQDKDVALLVTQAFPYPWMGGNRAIRQMRKALESKGARMRGSGIVNWMKSRRDVQIVEVVDRLSGLF